MDCIAHGVARSRTRLSSFHFAGRKHNWIQLREGKIIIKISLFLCYILITSCIKVRNCCVKPSLVPKTFREKTNHEEKRGRIQERTFRRRTWAVTRNISKIWAKTFQSSGGKISFNLEEKLGGTSLVVHWLGFSTLTVRSLDSISAGRIKSHKSRSLAKGKKEKAGRERQDKDW